MGLSATPDLPQRSALFFTLIMADTGVQVQAGLRGRWMAGANQGTVHSLSFVLSLFSQSPFIQRNSSVTVSLIIPIPWTLNRVQRDGQSWYYNIIYLSVPRSSVNGYARSTPGGRWNSRVRWSIVHCSAWQSQGNFVHIFRSLQPRTSRRSLKMKYFK